jgi:hypothetical protein
MAWPVIAGMVASMAGGAAGGAAANSASKEGANAAYDSAMQNIQLQRWLEKQNTARLKPFYEQGINALPEMESRRMGTYDIMSSPYASQRQDMMTNALSDQASLRGREIGGFGYDQSLRDLRSSEEGLGYDRALDRVRIGQGNAAQAGQQYGRFANALSSALQQSGNIQGQLRQQTANQNQQTMGNSIYTAAGYPAAATLYNARQNMMAQPMSDPSSYPSMNGGYSPQRPLYNAGY